MLFTLKNIWVVCNASTSHHFSKFYFIIYYFGSLTGNQSGKYLVFVSWLIFLLLGIQPITDKLLLSIEDVVKGVILCFINFYIFLLKKNINFVYGKYHFYDRINRRDF